MLVTGSLYVKQVLFLHERCVKHKPIQVRIMEEMALKW